MKATFIGRLHEVDGARHGVVWTASLAAINVAAYAVTLALAGGAQAPVPVLTQLALFAPGLLIVARASEPGDGWLPVITFGPFVGVLISYLLLLVGWAAGARGAWLLLAAPLLGSLLAWPAARLRGRWSLAALEPGDARMLLAVLLIVPIVVARPFSLVGAELPEGHVYRAYFTADYVWRRALVAELAKGDFLPANPFYLDDVLHYYWLPHLPSAIDYRALGAGANLDNLLLSGTVVIGAAFVAAIYGLTRLLVPSPLAAAGGVCVAFFVTSLEGTVGLYEHWAQGAPMSLVRYLNIDAVSRWLFGGMPIDGLHRILWYQPHHAMAYVLGFLGFVAVVRRRRVTDPVAFAVAGVLLGASVLFSSFAGLMFTTGTAVYEAGAVLRRRGWAGAVFNGAAAALPLVLAAAVVRLLGYVDSPPDDLSVIRFGWNPLSGAHFWTVAPMSIGPIFLFAVAGSAYAWKRRLPGLGPWLALSATTVVIYFYVDVRDHQDVYVGWRTGHLLFMAWAPLAGLAWMGLQALRGMARAAAGAAAAVVVLLAVPMPLIDMFNTQDVDNRAMGPGFRWTLVLSPSEWEGLTWIRDHTEPAALVQVDPLVRDPDTWAYIPAFAERRMAVGLPISMVPLRKYQEGSRATQWLFDAPDPLGAYELAARVGIDFVVLGEPERRAHEGVEARYARIPERFLPVFSNEALTVYAVERPGGHIRLH
jgi:hypothetical protein